MIVLILIPENEGLPHGRGPREAMPTGDGQGSPGRRCRQGMAVQGSPDETNTFDCFDCLSSSTGAFIIQNIGLSVGRWKKNQIIKKSKNFDYSDFLIIGDI